MKYKQEFHINVKLSDSTNAAFVHAHDVHIQATHSDNLGNPTGVFDVIDRVVEKLRGKHLVSCTHYDDTHGYYQIVNRGTIHEQLIAYVNKSGSDMKFDSIIPDAKMYVSRGGDRGTVVMSGLCEYRNMAINILKLLDMATEDYVIDLQVTCNGFTVTT